MAWLVETPTKIWNSDKVAGCWWFVAGSCVFLSVCGYVLVALPCCADVWVAGILCQSVIAYPTWRSPDARRIGPVHETPFNLVSQGTLCREKQL